MELVRFSRFLYSVGLEFLIHVYIRSFPFSFLIFTHITHIIYNILPEVLLSRTHASVIMHCGYIIIPLIYLYYYYIVEYLKYKDLLDRLLTYVPNSPSSIAYIVVHFDACVQPMFSLSLALRANHYIYYIIY